MSSCCGGIFVILYTFSRLPSCHYPIRSSNCCCIPVALLTSFFAFILVFLVASPNVFPTDLCRGVYTPCPPILLSCPAALFASKLIYLDFAEMPLHCFTPRTTAIAPGKKGQRAGQRGTSTDTEQVTDYSTARCWSILHIGIGRSA